MNTNSKHAYLILAHRDDTCFRTLLAMIDDSRNDIFIHMDKKCSEYKERVIATSLSHSKVYHVDRLNVAWGGVRMIEAEISLLKKATSTGLYQYYHLLSGQDLPIKSQDIIHDFFEKNDGKEFVRFNHSRFQYNERVQIYHFFQDKLGRNWQNIFNRVMLKVQSIIGIKRNKAISFYKGTQWFSITDNFARYVVENEGWVNKVFRYTFCCDEVFIQTLLIRSPYKDNRYWMAMDNDMHAIMRLIDWTRGTPYVFRMNDKEELMSSEMMFCRKFDERIDSDIILFLKRTFD